MNNDLLLVYNTCGISGRENIFYYKNSITSFLNQTKKNIKIVVSSCLNSENTKNYLRDSFGDLINYCFIDEKLPVNVTFNKTAQECVKRFGPFSGYLYIDSGISLEHDLNAIEKLYSLHCSKEYAMTCSRTDSDSGAFVWFNESQFSNDESIQGSLFKNDHLIIPIGKTLNLHCQIFDHSLYENFNQKLIPDIFASCCTESVFSYLCASVNKKFIAHKDVIAHHQTSMDGASSGFRPELVQFPAWCHTFIAPAPETIFKIVQDPEAVECGFGYEECNRILPHRPECYHPDGKSKDPERLKQFLKNNLYLTKEQLDYETIKCSFF
jgi:hypothetical protein